MDFVTGVDEYLSSGLLPIYYFICLLLFVRLGFLYKLDSFLVIVILMYLEGFFVYLGTFSEYIHEAYKIAIIIMSLFYLGNKLLFKDKNFFDYYLILLSVLILINYFYSGVQNSTPLLLTLSQFLRHHLIVVLLYFWLKNIHTLKILYYYKVFKSLFIIQILLAFLKLILFGFGESLIGSISFIGGGPSNILPVLGFVLIYIRKNEKLIKLDWLIVFGLFLVAIIGNKRSVMLILPLIIFLAYFINVNKKRIFNIKLLKFTPLVLFAFYIGVKVNPTLNPDDSRWGRFDYDYLINYSLNYTFGDADLYNSDLAAGRGGSFLYLLTEKDYDEQDLFYGYGLEEVKKDYENFDSEKYGIATKGSAGAVFQNYISFGLIGTILIYIFIVSLVLMADSYKLRIMLFIFLTWDYIFFYNSSVQITAMMVTLLFIIFTANKIYGTKKIDYNMFKTR